MRRILATALRRAALAAVGIARRIDPSGPMVGIVYPSVAQSPIVLVDGGEAPLQRAYRIRRTEVN